MQTKEIQNRLAENLKRIRKSRKLTQFQLAEMIGMSEETIKNVELSRA
jgi:transcriptional regulator with XRE-family HTH domain